MDVLFVQILLNMLIKLLGDGTKLFFWKIAEILSKASYGDFAKIFAEIPD